MFCKEKLSVPEIRILRQKMAPCKPRVKRKIKMIKNKKVSKAQFTYIFTINSYIFLFVFMHSGDDYSVVLRKDKKRGNILNNVRICGLIFN